MTNKDIRENTLFLRKLFDRKMTEINRELSLKKGDRQKAPILFGGFYSDPFHSDHDEICIFQQQKQPLKLTFVSSEITHFCIVSFAAF